MEATETLAYQPIQNEAFWKQHNDLFKSSGLSRADYCRQNNLNYYRFGYWFTKWNHSEQENKLISIKIKSSYESPQATTLCTLDLKNGHQLMVHDAKALLIILERYC